MEREQRGLRTGAKGERNAEKRTIQADFSETGLMIDSLTATYERHYQRTSADLKEIENVVDYWQWRHANCPGRQGT